jgi:ATP-dependent Clp protease ATP-binding subunit ClpB
MRIDQFTQKSQEAIAGAQEKATGLSHPEVRPYHLLWSLLGSDQATVRSLVSKLGPNPDHLRASLERELGKLPQSPGTATSLSRQVIDVLGEAQKQAERLKDEYVSTEHLLLALLATKTEPAGLLHQAGLSTDKVLGVLKDIRGNQRVTDQNPEARTSLRSPRRGRSIP